MPCQTGGRIKQNETQKKPKPIDAHVNIKKKL